MKNILIIILFAISQFIYSNEDKYFTKSYGNIELHTFSGCYTEKVNKAIIIANYAQILSCKLNFFKKIVIIFKENYNDEDFIFAYYQKKIKKENIDEDFIHIRLQLLDNDIAKSLNLIEFVILNFKKVENSKNELVRIYNSKPSERIIKILKEEKVYRPYEINELNKPCNVSYYYHNNKFNFYILDKNDNEILIKSTSNILDFEKLSNDFLILILSKNSIEIVNNEGVSLSVLNFKSDDNFYLPFKLDLITDDKISIGFHKYSKSKNRIMIYSILKNIFIEDLDKLF